ncbi:hypothetical protein RFI_03287 [Reticulomyxa filosa]|uniref:Tubulin alpha chain n=1 Tax=Reticulomyxa filosa TaxID=46433 RepID=X6P6K5_RETFI|nr:hypothetical protein RFI_03287 [Reticulomyxa filosa]|eukprot:ETO33811.1 hypothetical protein RFI_03287 [Reticulomyxa filosa]
MREVITIEVGQAGIQMGNAIWEQYCCEHGIDKKGKRKENEQRDHSLKIFFEEAGNGQFVPRNLAIDLEPNVIDDVKNGEYGAIFNHEFLINGQEDGSNNFARGYCSMGKQILSKVLDRIRKLVDHCDNVIGFIMAHSVGGGTGSGLGSLLLEHLTTDYGSKKTKLGFEVYPSPNLSTCVVEPYNALLATHYLIEHTQVSLVLDNEAIYDICQKQLHIIKPDVTNLNRLISKVISSMTASLRFSGELSEDISDFLTNLVPFPRLHFMTSGISPIVAKTDLETSSNEVYKITDDCFKPHNWFVKFTDFDPAEDKYMAISLTYRGDVQAKDANAAVQWLKSHSKVTLVEWCPTGFKIGLNDVPAATLESDDIGAFPKNAVMIANNTGIVRVFHKRIAQKYDLMYSQRAFVHWYVGEGMEEGEFAEARENLGLLEKDYLDMLKEPQEENSDS